MLFALYVAGDRLARWPWPFVLKRTVMRASYHPLLLELPEYHWPNLRNLLIGLWERTRIFLEPRRHDHPFADDRAVVPEHVSGAAGRMQPDRQSSTASPAYIGRGLEYVFAPIGFNWQISLALVPGLAAREVAVGALGTVYSLSATDDDVAGALTPMIASTWSLATALSLLAWYVFAPQCLSTLAVVKRETNSWRYPLIMAAYLFALAYVASFITYRVAVALTA